MHLKSSLLFTFLLLISLQNFSQKGFKVIDKAEKKHNQGKYKKALKLLTKADGMSYGFCGNAWMDANRAINLLRYFIYRDQKEYSMSRAFLDSIHISYTSDNLDSLKIISYQQEYGKEVFDTLFIQGMLNCSVTCNEYDCFSSVPLSNGDTVTFKSSLALSLKLADEPSFSKRSEIWLSIFIGSANYKLIINHE